jgi:hypothetical protein
MAVTTQSRTIDQVKVGEELPQLDYPVTTTTIVLGAMASRDWRPMHHDYHFAVERQGTQDIFMNTPNQSAWFERFLTDWSGPRGRIGRMRFRMRSSVWPDEVMSLVGTVTNVETDGTGCGWAEVDLAIKVEERVATQCTARIALPTTSDDNPWDRRGERWQP